MFIFIYFVLIIILFVILYKPKNDIIFSYGFFSKNDLTRKLFTKVPLCLSRNAPKQQVHIFCLYLLLQQFSINTMLTVLALQIIGNI